MLLPCGKPAVARSRTPPEASLLDVGCGLGELVREAERHGWRARGTASSDEDASPARAAGIDVIVADVASLPDDTAYGVVTFFHVVEHTADLGSTIESLDRVVLPGGYLVLEYPNGRSLLKASLGWRWFGYDPPYHRLQVNPTVLADRLGLANYRLLDEEHFSLEYSFVSVRRTAWLTPWRAPRTPRRDGTGDEDGMGTARRALAA